MLFRSRGRAEHGQRRQRDAPAVKLGQQAAQRRADAGQHAQVEHSFRQLLDGAEAIAGIAAQALLEFTLRRAWNAITACRR